MADEKFMQFLEILEEPDRKLMSMRYLEGCTQAETAAALGKTPAEVSRRERILNLYLQRKFQER